MVWLWRWWRWRLHVRISSVFLLCWSFFFILLFSLLHRSRLRCGANANVHESKAELQKTNTHTHTHKEGAGVRMRRRFFFVLLFPPTETSWTRMFINKNVCRTHWVLDFGGWRGAVECLWPTTATTTSCLSLPAFSDAVCVCGLTDIRWCQPSCRVWFREGEREGRGKEWCRCTSRKSCFVAVLHTSVCLFSFLFLSPRANK
jgi:hypothetical protein